MRCSIGSEKNKNKNKKRQQWSQKKVTNKAVTAMLLHPEDFNRVRVLTGLELIAGIIRMIVDLFNILSLNH